MLLPSGFFKDFIQLSISFWKSDQGPSVQRLTLALVALTILQVVIAVLITEWSANLFNALEQHSMADFFMQIGLIILIFVGNIVVAAAHLKFKRRLQIDWRTWLTNHLSARWMHEGHHYLITHVEGGKHDNPDGRIAEDARIATESAIDLCHSLFYSLLLLVSFTKILWSLSGVVTLDLGFVRLPIYGHLVWLAMLYACAGSYLGWLIGKPLTAATDARQSVEADFRFRLVRQRENSQAIALVRGETMEQNRLTRLFNHIVAAWQRQTEAWSQILMFTSGYSVLSMAFPIIVSAPRYILGSISLGAMMQSVQSFQQLVSALSWPVDNMAKVAEWRASVERVQGLLNALDTLEREMGRPDPRKIRLVKSTKPILAFHDLCIAKLNGEVIIAGINEEIFPRQRVLLTGNAFTGSKLIKAIAGLWPWGCGQIELPDDEPMYFVPPKPYLPTVNLGAAICYPSPLENYSASEIEHALNLAGLSVLASQFTQTEVWEDVLSREEQQRIGLVRLLLNRPKWVLLQEAFDALSPEGEMAVLHIIAHELPEATFITISNQPAVQGFHNRRIHV
ncbi:MAG: ABC transporter ATP-binding protein/permease [Methylococcaceae bacterium]|jgi:putative ATP-binding cassette transporter